MARLVMFADGVHVMSTSLLPASGLRNMATRVVDHASCGWLRPRSWFWRPPCGAAADWPWRDSGSPSRSHRLPVRSSGLPARVFVASFDLSSCFVDDRQVLLAECRCWGRRIACRCPVTAEGCGEQRRFCFSCPYSPPLAACIGGDYDRGHVQRGFWRPALGVAFEQKAQSRCLFNAIVVDCG